MPQTRALALAFIAATAIGPTARAQLPVTVTPGSWVGSPLDEYARLMQLTGVAPLSSRMLRPAANRAELVAPPDSAPWRSPWVARYAGAPDSAAWSVTALAPEVRTTLNSATPHSINDGAMWAGRGVNALFRAGGRATYRADRATLELQLVPEYTWSSNDAFPLAALLLPPDGASPYADQFHSARMDRPQRFGDQSLSRFEPGQSRLTARAYGVVAGFSTENMWWGPGIDNSLLMSNTAAGFPHTILGSAEPIDIRIGHLEVQHTVGWLRQSEFWRADADSIPRRRWLNALSVVFEPDALPGMYFMLSRVFVAHEEKNPIRLGEIASLLQTFRKESLADSANPGGNDRRDQMLSLGFRWVFPSPGFEVYGEWGRNDHNWNWRDFVLEPDHSRAWMLGARKVLPVAGGLLALRVEATDMSRTRTELVRATPIWYTHHHIKQGYTQRGQMIGAGIGPGSDAQTLAADWFASFGGVGFQLFRLRNDNDGFYRTYGRPGSALNNNHEVTIGFGPRITAFVRGARLDATYELRHNLNRYLILKNDVTNHHLRVTIGLAP